MYNDYSAVKTYWADTMNMDNLRGGTFANSGSGWDVTTYALVGGSLQDFPSDLSKLNTVGHAHVQTLNYHDDFANDIPGTPDENFALVATGAITLSPGEHTFCTASDDGSWLYLDGALLVNNGGLHGTVKVCQTTSVAKGAHTVLVNFFERDGGAVLVVTLDDELLTPNGKAAAGGLEGSSTADGVGGFGSTAHTYSGDTFY
jgi:hypothetical protein